MSGVNKVILVGHLGQDPRVKYFDDKNCTADFSLATSEKFTDKDGNKIEQTEWHKIVLRNNVAQVAEKYLHKGDLIYVEGKLKTRNYEDKDKIKRYITEVIGSAMTMLSTKGIENGNKVTTAQSTITQNTTSIPLVETHEEPASAQPGDSLPF